MINQNKADKTFWMNVREKEMLKGHDILCFNNKLINTSGLKCCSLTSNKKSPSATHQVAKVHKQKFLAKGEERRRDKSVQLAGIGLWYLNFPVLLQLFCIPY